MGKGSRFRDWKGLTGGTGETEKIAEKNKKQESEEESMGEEVGQILKLWEGKPMGRGE